MDNWPFADPKNVATITVRQIIEGKLPILLVDHSADDGSWQFLSGGNFTVADGMIINLSNMIQRDPTLLDLADLPLGWQATRAKVGDPWKYQKNS